ncbi:OmpA family protein [Aquimarina spongiae]|uniref:WD40-like Beta Propeller Repeat n=1 Tax=Aquimarina spongiae TaxID=570521 RepID=A0A1M6IV06_9FLAO|nr:OmpA family protein [Aquimarina spongiae]SHJ38286.1 WD40-like Beta Propeller Repeat [Aquimarina spongiae]
MKNCVIQSLSIFTSKKLVTIGALFLLPLLFYAQGDDKLIEKADERFDAFAYIDARAIYLDVAQKGYASQLLYQKLADSFYFTADLEESLEWYEKLISTYPEDIDPEYLFRYAQSLKSVERYVEADEMMDQFYQLTGGDKRAKSFINKRNYLDFIEMQSGKYDLFTLNINTRNSEYAPSFNHNNQVVFASSRSKETKDSKIHAWTKTPFLDLYSATIQEDQINLQKPVKLKGKINTKFHESSSSFSKDGKTVYFSRNNFTNNKLGKSRKGVVLLKIYRASLIDGKWTNIVELPFSSDNYSVSHPALSADGKKLYFASDMPGTLGQSDLYVVDILGNQKYGNPKNLGPKINTEGRETFPYISDSGRLYFASDGHVGLGGLDIFVAVPSESGFSGAFNVGRPVNSSKDDFTFVLNEETKIGYFASNRRGGKGNDDIYSFKQTEELITTCKQYIQGIVSNTATNESMPGVTLALLNATGNTITETITNSVGQYTFDIECEKQYTVHVAKDFFIPKDIPVTSDDTYEFLHDVPVPLTPEQQPELLLTSVAVNVGDDLGKILQLESIYFGLDDATITPQAEVELQKVISALQKYPELKIEVRSHTDSRSSYWYNKKLSVKRMRATTKYIITNGLINWRRVRGKAYGERRLINDCTDDVPCTEEEHQQNRRSEFIVIK